MTRACALGMRADLITPEAQWPVAVTGISDGLGLRRHAGGRRRQLRVRLLVRLRGDIYVLTPRGYPYGILEGE